MFFVELSCGRAVFFFAWLANRAFSSRLKPNAAVVDVIMDFFRKLRRFRFFLMMYLIFYLLEPVSLSVIIIHIFFIYVEPVK